MYDAEVGDDVFGEDPTVIQLQDEVAILLGKEAGLFVPSGVMGNQLALRVHTSPGDEVILDSGSHIANYESGASGAISGVQLKTIDGKRGVLSASQVESAIRAGYYWEPNPRLICVENTHNRAGGVVFPLKEIDSIAELGRRRGLALHLDGARLWNASAATGISEADYAAAFDSVSVCLSKGLGAPVGSVLAGSRAFIEEAHRFRKMFGGGMRQVGVLAAAGLYALHHHRGDLAQDHENAGRLAAGLASIDGFDLDAGEVETNIVVFDVARTGDALSVLDTMQQYGILMVPFGPSTIRATTHRDVSAADIDSAIESLKDVFG